MFKSVFGQPSFSGQMTAFSHRAHMDGWLQYAGFMYLWSVLTSSQLYKYYTTGSLVLLLYKSIDFRILLLKTIHKLLLLLFYSFVVPQTTIWKFFISEPISYRSNVSARRNKSWRNLSSGDGVVMLKSCLRRSSPFCQKIQMKIGRKNDSRKSQNLLI